MKINSNFAPCKSMPNSAVGSPPKRSPSVIYAILGCGHATCALRLCIVRFLCMADPPGMFYSYLCSSSNVSRPEGEQHLALGTPATPMLHVLVHGDGVTQERVHHRIHIASSAIRGSNRGLRRKLRHLCEFPQALLCISHEAFVGATITAMLIPGNFWIEVWTPQ